jgi:Dolichyl-phosphate-mannose-protein mannosyltransferase
MGVTGGTAPASTRRASEPGAGVADSPDSPDSPDAVVAGSAPPSGRGGRLRRWGPALLGAGWVIALGLPRLGRRPFWIDEAFTVGATHDLVATWRGTGGTMGLYYLVMWPVAQVSLDRAWLRLPSLLFAAATVVVVHEIGRLIGGRRVGAMAAGLLAASWVVARYGLEARSYALALLLVSLSWLGLVGAVEAGDRAGQRWWWVFVVATLLAPLAHGLAALHFASQVAVLGLAPDRRRWWRRCVPVAAALAVEGVVLFSLGAGEVANWIAPLNRRQVSALLRMLVGKDTRLAVIGALVVVAVALAAADAWRERRRRSARSISSDDRATTETWLRLVPVFWMAGVPLLIVGLSLFRPYAEPRYVIGAVPGVALVLAGLLARIRPVAFAAAAWVALALVLVTDQPHITPRGSEDWPTLVEQVAADGHDGDRLLMPAMLRSPFDYAWAEHDGPAVEPAVVPLSPTDAVGDVKRFYEVAPGDVRAQLRAAPVDGAAVWYVDRDIKRRDDVDALVADPEVARNYRVTGRWEFTGELYLVRFEPRAAP